MKKQKLTRAEEAAYRDLAKAARRLQQIQERAKQKADARRSKAVPHE